MKFLVAIALLTLAVASAHHNPQHTLRGPRFQPGKAYKYDVEFNVTSGVLGLSSQVSKTAFSAEAIIYAKEHTDQKEQEHILKIQNVYTSGSIKAVDSKYTDIKMESNSELEDRLSVPIKFTMLNGEVTSYTLSPTESLESKKIKKSILRSLEMHVPESALLKMESKTELKVPVTYNTSKTTDSGLHTTHYMITVSPYVEFPVRQDVYNISRTDDFEAQRYPAHQMHHNFRKQGCSEVCRKDWKTNNYGAGCPVGHEPHHSPIKMSFNHEHHLSLLNNVMTPEIIRTVEVHVAQMYDQDMEVLFLHQMKRKQVTNGAIVEPSGQTTYRDLKDWDAEIDEEEIEEQCEYKKAAESISSIKTLLKDIAEIIVKGELENEKTKSIGQKIILLKNALTRLSVQDLEKIWNSDIIVRPANLEGSEMWKKVARQIWLDVLPITGTEEAVTFITQYIKKGLMNDELLVWEAKEMLESLPQNIHKPTERNVKDLWSLITEHDIKEKMENNHLLHSAAYLTLARTIAEMCGNPTVVRSQPKQKSSWFNLGKHLGESSSRPHGPVQCPHALVDEITQDVTRKLEASRKKEDIAVYLEALAHIGTPEVLPVLAKYVYGTAENLQRYSPSYTDFVKTVSLFALHNAVGKHQEEVLEIVLPVFFNGTENPKIRNAAFGVLIRCQPSLEVLQHIAIRSWSEQSREVGSYVTSTLETFGNSSLPCMQLTSHRIKKVMPQLKRFDIGVNHAKNLLWSYFDEQRELGLEGRLEYTPSNESFIPSTLYKSLSYSTDSLRDVLMQMALNIQGLTHEMIWEKIEKFLDLKPIRSFDPRREKEIFGQANIRSRVPEALRLTLYKRIFYCSSYNYLDSDNIWEIARTLREYLEKYLKESHSDYEGYLVKTMLPSNYHTVAIARTLPYPVEFEMKQPLVLAVKVKSLEKSPEARNFHMYIRPSVYYTKLYTNQMKNIGDCKEVGVYHEHKVALSYPFELKFNGMQFPNITLKYRIPELNKQVLTYSSESGTYAAKKELEILPSSANREPIRTQPTPFKIEKKVQLPGVPPLRVQIQNEDISWGIERLPRNLKEALHIVVKKIHNVGWRQESLVVTPYDDAKVWPKNTEVTVKLQYHREHITKSMNEPQRNMEESQWNSQPQDEAQSSFDSQWQDNPQPQYPYKSQSQDEAQSQWFSESGVYTQSAWGSQSEEEIQSPGDSQSQNSQSKSSAQSWFWRKHGKEEDWSKYFTPTDISYSKNPETYMEQARTIYRFLQNTPHIRHVCSLEVNTTPLRTSAYIKVDYNHTYFHKLHNMRVQAVVNPKRKPHPYEITLDHLMVAMDTPNEFKYRHNPQQKAFFISAFGVSTQASPKSPWENYEAVFKGILSYKNPEETLQNELWTRVDPKYFLPEFHESCRNDQEKGKPLSINCVNAVRESSIYNRLYMTALWNKNTPEFLKMCARRTDIYVKHFLFPHMNITDGRHAENKITLEVDHIDKFVDEPVFDIKVQKPDEIVEFKRVPSKGFQPLNSVYSNMDVVAMHLTNNTYPPTCAMMKDYVRTYDMKTYRFTAEKCNYILSTHCTKNKHFAIIAKALDRREGTKEITMYLAENTVVLTPPSHGEYKIRFNNREVEVTKGTVLDKNQEIYAYLEEVNDGMNLRVVAKRAGIKLVYDGVNVKVQIHPRYRGELCGLCSEFDGEEIREYRGVDQCLYTHPIDFANSAITNREGNCDKRRPYGERTCYGAEESNAAWRQPSENDEEYEPSKRRNVVQTRGDEYCFSNLPVPVCEDDAPPAVAESKMLRFHCLPKGDITAKKLLTESKRRVLGEIASKSSDFEEIVQVAKRC